MDLKQKLNSKIEEIYKASQSLSFEANCDLDVANFAATLARGVGGNWLELGTGLALLFLAETLADGRLDSVDNDPNVSKAAEAIIGTDKNINFIVQDGGSFLKDCKQGAYRFIFADAWPGKFSHLNEALKALEVGGLYLIDDLLPQVNWPPNHQPRVDALLSLLSETEKFALSYIDWGSGVAVVTKLDEGGVEDRLVQNDAYAFLFSEEIPRL